MALFLTLSRLFLYKKAFHEGEAYGIVWMVQRFE